MTRLALDHCSDVEGLVGPLVNSGVLLVEALPECVADACDVDAREDMIQFVRQVSDTSGRTLNLWWSRQPLQLGLLRSMHGSWCLMGHLLAKHHHPPSSSCRQHFMFHAWRSTVHPAAGRSGAPR